MSVCVCVCVCVYTLRGMFLFVTGLKRWRMLRWCTGVYIIVEWSLLYILWLHPELWNLRFLITHKIWDTEWLNLIVCLSLLCFIDCSHIHLLGGNCGIKLWKFRIKLVMIRKQSLPLWSNALFWWTGWMKLWKISVKVVYLWPEIRTQDHLITRKEC